MSDTPVRLVMLPAATLAALLDNDLPAAGAAGLALPGFFLADEFRRPWRIHLDGLTADPGSARWRIYAVVAGSGVVVGNAGFHGPPDDEGMVEVGYSVDPAHRRRGYARATLRELFRIAAGDPAVTTVRASIRPDNAASLATIAGFGFERVGERWDDEDGLEIVFEAGPSRGSHIA